MHAGAGRPTPSPKSWPREAVELGWHLAIVALVLPPVAGRIARSRAAAAIAGTALVVGAGWHVAVCAADRLNGTA
jgi:hypothetical protein